MEKQLIKTDSASILPKILQTEQPEQRAVILLKHVQSSDALPESVAIDHQTHPTLHTWRRTVGHGTVRMFVVLLVEDCLRSLNITNQPSKGQVMEMAKEIVADYPTLKPEQLRRFFTNVKKGMYGADFNRFDISTVYRNLNIFQAECNEVFERAMEKKKHEQNTVVVRISDDVLLAEYNRIKKEGSISAAERTRKYQEKLKAATAQWQKDYDKYFTNNELTPQSHMAYIKKYPLNQEYIDYFG